MKKATTNVGIQGEWRKLVTAFDSNAADLADLGPTRVRLGDLLSWAEEAAHTASKQTASQELKTILAEGQRLATGLRKLIRTHYGTSSEKLVEFDIQPFRARSRKVAPVEIPETPEGLTPE